MDSHPTLVVASDLDGTLLTSDRLVTPRTRRVVERIRRAGGTFVAVTARPLRDAVQIAGEVGANRLVCSSGAVVFDPGTGTVVHTTTLSMVDAAAVAASLRTRFPDLRIGIDYLHRCELDPGFDLGWHGAADLIRSSEVTVAAEPVVKLIIQSESIGPEQLADEARGLLGTGQGRLTITVPCPQFVEILPAGVDKAGYLARLRTGGPATAARTVAFGDMPGDLPMLRWANTAVAVSNAHPTVLAAVDEVTGSNDDEGVSAFLERLLDEPAHTPLNLHRRTQWST